MQSAHNQFLKFKKKCIEPEVCNLNCVLDRKVKFHYHIVTFDLSAWTTSADSENRILKMNIKRTNCLSANQAQLLTFFDYSPLLKSINLYLLHERYRENFGENCNARLVKR